MKVSGWKVKLAIGIVAIIIGSNVALKVVVENEAKKTVKENVELYMDSIVSSAANQIHNTTVTNFRFLEGIAAIDFVSDDSVPLVSKCQRLRKTLSVDPNYQDIVFIDRDGNSYLKDGRKVNLGNREYFKSSLAGAKVVDNPFISPINNMLLQHYSVPIYTDKGDNTEAIGVLCLNMYGDSLSRSLNSVDFGKDSHILVVDRTTGEYVASTALNEVVDKFNVNEKLSHIVGLQEITDDILSGGIGNATFVDPETKVDQVLCYSTISGTNWSVVCSCPSENFYSGLAGLERFINTVLLVVLVVSTTIGLLVMSLILVPVVDDKEDAEEARQAKAAESHEAADAESDEVITLKVMLPSEVAASVNTDEARSKICILQGVSDKKDDKIMPRSQKEQSETKDGHSPKLKDIIGGFHSRNGRVALSG